MNDEVLLEVNHITMQFGGLTAISDVSILINRNDLVAIIGPNGAGKTTFFNVITGIYKPTKGLIIFNNKKLESRFKTHQITKAGIARTFQNIRLFKELTVIDNIRIGHHSRVEYGFFTGILRTSKFRVSEEQLEKECDHLLDLFELKDKKYSLAKNLSYGEQRKLEIIRALATKPLLLLLDEPAAGMNPTETKQLMELIQKVKTEFQISIILIEHDMRLVMNLAQKIFVLNYGCLIASGSPAEIQNNQMVIEAYLGSESDLELA